MSSLGYLAAVNVVIWVGPLRLPLAAGPPHLGKGTVLNMKKGYWLAAAFTLAFVGFGLTAFQKTLTPYLSFDEAKKSRGVVQVMGALDKQSDRYDAKAEELGFDLVDADGRAPARRVPRRRPGNFKDAISIVAIGRYHEGRIEAEKLLVKCPSKYQGAEVEKAYASKPAPGKAS